MMPRFVESPMNRTFRPLKHFLMSRSLSCLVWHDLGCHIADLQWQESRFLQSSQGTNQDAERKKWLLQTKYYMHALDTKFACIVFSIHEYCNSWFTRLQHYFFLNITYLAVTSILSNQKPEDVIHFIYAPFVTNRLNIADWLVVWLSDWLTADYIIW